jgi:hypothetical protein
MLRQWNFCSYNSGLRAAFQDFDPPPLLNGFLPGLAILGTDEKKATSLEACS